LFVPCLKLWGFSFSSNLSLNDLLNTDKEEEDISLLWLGNIFLKFAGVEVAVAS